MNGWKEIASYLGKSPRSVQRWEHDLGLPVHRILTPDEGSIVYAFASELDAWRTRHQGDAADGATPCFPKDAASTVSSVTSATGADDRGVRPGSTPRRWLWLHTAVPAWATLALTGLATVVGLSLGKLPNESGVAATWELEGRQLRAYTTGGRALWEHQFGQSVSRPGTLSRGGGAQFDFDNDGRNESLVPVRFSSSSRDTGGDSDAVVAFAHDGRRLWSVQPQLALRAGAETFEGPWRVYDIATGVTPAGPRAWIAFSHHTWWPAFVVEVEADGKQRLRYVQGGRVYSLGYWQSDGKALLVAGGTAREPGLASAVVVDLSAPEALWPTDGGARLSCDGCPRADPRAVMLFPTSHVTTALQRPYGWVFGMKTEAAGMQVAINDGFGSGTLVSFTEQLDLVGFERSDQYWHVHRDLESQGRISHAVEDCPDRSMPLEVRIWTPPSGWRTQSAPLRISRSTPTAR